MDSHWQAVIVSWTWISYLQRITETKTSSCIWHVSIQWKSICETSGQSQELRFASLLSSCKIATSLKGYSSIRQDYYVGCCMRDSVFWHQHTRVMKSRLVCYSWICSLQTQSYNLWNCFRHILYHQTMSKHHRLLSGEGSPSKSDKCTSSSLWILNDQAYLDGNSRTVCLLSVLTTSIVMQAIHRSEKLDFSNMTSWLNSDIQAAWIINLWTGCNSSLHEIKILCCTKEE
jgi:hypothetical protein